MESTSFALSLGCNVGAAESVFVSALAFLRGAGADALRVSSIHLTAAVDCVPGTPDFQNAVAVGLWPGVDVFAFLDACQAVEAEFGRPAVRWKNSPRQIDLDIILFGSMVVNVERLRVPHPRAGGRLFVLAPLCELCPDILFPDCGLTARQLLDTLQAGGAHGQSIIGVRPFQVPPLVCKQTACV